MFTIFLVEQDKNFEDLIQKSAQLRKFNIIGHTDSLLSAFWQISKTQPEVVLIDLEGIGEEGYELAEEINGFKHIPLLIYASYDEQIISKTYHMGALEFSLTADNTHNNKRENDNLHDYYKDYMKRVYFPQYNSYEYDGQTVRNKYTDKFIIKLEDRIKVINTDEIVYIGTENRQVYVKTIHDHYNVDTPMYIIEQKLGPSFVRVHKSFIINIYYLTEIQPWFNGTYSLVFADGSKTPVSRSHIRNFRRTLGF